MRNWILLTEKKNQLNTVILKQQLQERRVGRGKVKGERKREEKEKQLQLDYPETFLSKMSFCC